jgi:hypothetical protein
MEATIFQAKVRNEGKQMLILISSEDGDSDGGDYEDVLSSGMWCHII